MAKTRDRRRESLLKTTMRTSIMFNPERVPLSELSISIAIVNQSREQCGLDLRFHDPPHPLSPPVHLHANLPHMILSACSLTWTTDQPNPHNLRQVIPVLLNGGCGLPRHPHHRKRGVIANPIVPLRRHRTELALLLSRRNSKRKDPGNHQENVGRE
jgi:hypothetical protein